MYPPGKGMAGESLNKSSVEWRVSKSGIPVDVFKLSVDNYLLYSNPFAGRVAVK